MNCARANDGRSRANLRTSSVGPATWYFRNGTPGARVNDVGEARACDEDREGKPFVGRAGGLLDKMLAAIEYGRHQTRRYNITNVLPWAAAAEPRP